MSEYGQEKDLREILQELVGYCANNSSEYPVSIKIALPKTIMKRFNLQFQQIQNPQLTSIGKLDTLYLNGGQVEFLYE